MITMQDLDEAIAECQGQRNPNANTCVKLAAFYTIRRELYGEEKKDVQLSAGYSYSPAPYIINNPDNSEFARAVDGRKQSEVWPELNEMMETIQMIHPKLYNAVLDRLR